MVIALVKELLELRLSSDPEARAVLPGGSVDSLDEITLAGLPEAAIAVIAQTYARLKKEGLPDTAIIDQIEQHRASLGQKGSLPEPSGIREYIEYRVRLEHAEMRQISDDILHKHIDYAFSYFGKEGTEPVVNTTSHEQTPNMPDITAGTPVKRADFGSYLKGSASEEEETTELEETASTSGEGQATELEETASTSGEGQATDVPPGRVVGGTATTTIDLIKWKECPRCAEEIKRRARFCKHCKYEYTEQDYASEQDAFQKLEERKLEERKLEEDQRKKEAKERKEACKRRELKKKQQAAKRAAGDEYKGYRVAELDNGKFEVRDASGKKLEGTRQYRLKEDAFATIDIIISRW